MTIIIIFFNRAYAHDMFIRGTCDFTISMMVLCPDSSYEETGYYLLQPISNFSC